MEVINQIILSSGTVAYLPIFPAIHVDIGDPVEYVKASRAYAVLTNYNGSINAYQAYSDEDVLELINIINGTNYTSFEWRINEMTNKHRCVLICWIWNEYDQTWNLYGPSIIPEYSSNTHAVIDVRNVFGESSSYYWGNESHYSEAWHSYADKCAAIEESTVTDFALNVRPGVPYTLDLACNYGYYGIPNQRSYSPTQLGNNIAKYLEDHPDADITVMGYDPEDDTDPFIVDNPAGFGGGTGSHGDPDDIEKATIPPLPSISAVDTGLITMYGATLAQLQSLGAYLWASWWDIETNFKKLFSDPMNCLIGLSIIPVRPTMGGAQNVKFGNITTSVALNKLSSQWAEVDCGTLSVKEYVGSFLDYSPYVNISIYLPYIGYRELSPDDVMNDTIHVVYHIDCLTGGCCAFVECGKKGLLYTFNGSCIANVPITAINYSGAIQNAVSAVGAVAMTGVGIATGAAPLTAMGVTSGLSNAANTAANTKPTVQRSGNMGGAAGLMSYQKPLLVITRPRMSVPDKLNKFTGLTTNVTMPLSSCVGFTQVELIHLDGVPCTDNERSELLSLLKQGVIF